MLTITVDEKELFDESTNAFIVVPKMELHLEHSLISLSRWESKWKKPFLGTEDHTKEEILDYIAAMCVDKNVDMLVIQSIDVESYKKILEYISDANSATKIYDRRPQKPGKKDVITSELIYYWMIYYGIPFECQKWHLNRLMTLIRICGIKGGTTNQSMDMNSIFAQNKALNAARRMPR